MRTRLGLAFLGGLLVSAVAGCSSYDSTSFTQDEQSDGVLRGAPGPADGLAPSTAELLASPNLEEREAAFQSLANAPLRDDERDEIVLLLQDNGVAMEEVSFVGRLVQVGDEQATADELLEAAAVEKARVFSTTSSETRGTPAPTPQLPVLPFLFAKNNASGQFTFWRPTQHHFIAVVVPDTPTFLLQLMKNAVSRWLSANANDCLNATAGSESIRVMTVSTFNALSTSEKQSTPCINVVYGVKSVACPNSTLNFQGCSLGMRQVAIKVGSTFENRVVIGPRIGLLDPDVTGTDSSSQWVALHELGHTLGFSHSSQSTATSLTVPGTNGDARAASVMQQERCDAATQARCTTEPETTRPICCSWFPLLTADDKRAVGTLYQSLPSTGCNYVHDFQVIPALP